MSIPRRWLERFLAEAFLRRRNVRRVVLQAPHARAKRRALALFAHRGLAFGTPLLARGQVLSRDLGELRPIIAWLAVLADVVDEVARVLDEEGLSPLEARARRVRALSRALALVYATDDDAALLTSAGADGKRERAWLSLEREIAKRRYLQGNPLLGLTLNHALAATDARALLDVVLATYGEPATVVHGKALQERLVHERLALVAAIARLSEWREEIDAELVRGAALWQVKALGLPRPDTLRLVEQVKRPAELARLVTLVPPGARERVMLHTLLAACVDGRVSPEERAFATALGGVLGIARPRQRRLEQRVVEFVRTNRDQFNPLAYAAGFAAAGPPISVRFARVLWENMDALWLEIRETGDLTRLLARRAAGQTLTHEETARMKEQLLDVARAVPSLAVFTLPGGFLLLPVLLKLLPFDLRTSAFRAHDDFQAFEDDLEPPAGDGAAEGP